MITIVTVCRNSCATIQSTFDSIIRQTYKKPFEYIVVDGNSTDGTIDIIQENKEAFSGRNIHFTFISEPDQGIYEAMNKGIRMAQGEIIGILNSDDYYEPNALEAVAHYAIEHPDYDIYYGHLRLLMESGEELQTYRYRYENYLTKLGCGCESAAQHPTCFISRSLYERIGLYDLSFRTSADYDFLLRAKTKGARFKAIDQIITNFSLGGASDTLSDYERSDQRYRAQFNNGLISTDEYTRLKKDLRYMQYKRLKHRIAKSLFGLNK